MSNEATTPRLVYRGEADATAETCEVKDADELAKALKEGWRLRRVDKKHQAPEEVGTVDVPAQKLQTGAGKK